MHLWVLDVGQGQALALHFPGDRWMLVDAGGFPDSEFAVGAEVVVPALEAPGVRTLWRLVSTHPHPAPLGGAAALLEWRRPEVLWLPGGFSEDSRYPPLEEARRHGTHVTRAPPGPVAAVGAARIETEWLPAEHENGRSLALNVTLGDPWALLPAHLGAAQRNRWAETGFAADCTVVVAPHHGSDGSASRAFLRSARPPVARASAAGGRGLPSARFRGAVAETGAAFASTHSAGCILAWVGPPGAGGETVTRVALTPRDPSDSVPVQLCAPGDQCPSPPSSSSTTTPFSAPSAPRSCAKPATPWRPQRAVARRWSTSGATSRR